ncbi:hypothetical protein KCP78_16710 [Salmonella enterica subsp. enterica]|nr:hypothetical protein KCP78_16710 [Salmonella enterica subsp. enterica]
MAYLLQPDRPAGRGKVDAQPGSAGGRKGLPVFRSPCRFVLRKPASGYDLHADVMVVVAYGLILPKAVPGYAPSGCINVHGSLLPR